MIISATGRYRDATTTLRPQRKTSAAGIDYLQISARAWKRAADACCYAGDDYPVIDAPPATYGPWQWTEDGRLISWSSERAAPYGG